MAGPFTNESISYRTTAYSNEFPKIWIDPDLLKKREPDLGSGYGLKMPDKEKERDSGNKGGYDVYKTKTVYKTDKFAKPYVS